MNGHHAKKHDKYKRRALASLSELTDMITQRHEEMQQKWADLDQGWKDLQEKMNEVGLTMNSSIAPETLLLNVGGSELHLPRSILEEMRGSTLGDLFGGGLWDTDSIPRDSDETIVLDESPACVEYLINKTSSRSGTTEGSPAAGVGDLAADELAYLPHVAAALDLSSHPVPPYGMAVMGGSTVLQASEAGPITSVMKGWCPGEPEGLELLFRASRDGWTPAAFHAKCDSSCSTITIVRVKANDGEANDSIVGGFSSISWAGCGKYAASPGAFIFMLKDGSSSASETFQPAKWGVKDGQAANAVYQNPTCGPSFGRGHDMAVELNQTPPSLYATPRSYAGSPYLALKGRPVVEMEVFRVSPEATITPRTTIPLPTPQAANRFGEGLIDCSAIFDAAPMSIEEHEDDVHRFGVSVAESLQEEQAALYHAQLELIQASVKAASSRTALAAVYGPDVVAGKKDPVVELSVRGPRNTARMTTLLSTLQACPDSALARRFDSSWTEREDPHGRAMINDCTPTVFSKVLDVLRMRKRVALADSNGGMGWAPMVRVAVNAADRDAFLSYVNMYFVGCESFITDHIEFLHD